MFILIGPHVRDHEIATIWSVLAARRLEPHPLDTCPRRHLSREQGLALVAALPESAPIKEPEDGQQYVMIPFGNTERSMRRVLESALGSTIKGTAKIPRWAGGKKLKRSMRLQDHPEAMLRELIIVPGEEAMPLIKPFFVNHEDNEVRA